MDAQNCIACGHSVVAWCPEESSSDDDLVCYNCGTHKNGEAAKIIADLRAKNEQLQMAAGIDARAFEAMRKDAERYRWLERQMIEYADDSYGDTWARMKWLVGPASLSPSTLKEAIDAAMKGGE